MSKVFKRPMFKMGGNTNSGIVSGFEREKFEDGTQKDYIDEYQQKQNEILADLGQKTDELFPQDIPDYAKPGFGLSEYLSLAKLGANILGSPNTGPGFARFAQRNAPAFGQFASELDASNQLKLNRKAELEAARRKALLQTAATSAEIAGKGATTSLQAEVTQDQLRQEADKHSATIASQEKIATWELETQIKLQELDRLEVEAVLQDSLILQNLIRGSNPDGTNDEKVRRQQAINQLEQLASDKTAVKEKALADLIKNDLLQSNAQSMSALPDAERPVEYQGKNANEIAALMAKEQIDNLLPDELFVPDFDPSYTIPQEDLAWWSRGGKSEPLRTEFKADGGRIGFANGGSDMPNATPLPGPPFEPGSGPDPDPGSPPIMQASAPQQTSPLSYEELRARLPKEVSDSVIRLLSTSEQALIDFAQIQTPDDLSRFNQKYNADLVLPAQTQVV